MRMKIMKYYVSLLLLCLGMHVQAQDSFDLISEGISCIQNEMLKLNVRKKCPTIRRGPTGLPGLPGLPGLSGTLGLQGPTGTTGNQGAVGSPGEPSFLDEAYAFFFSAVDQGPVDPGEPIVLEGAIASQNISSNLTNDVFTVNVSGNYAITYVVNPFLVAGLPSLNYSIGLTQNSFLIPLSAYSAPIGSGGGSSISFYMVGQVIVSLNVGDTISLINADTTTTISLNSVNGSYAASLNFQKL